MSVVPKGRSQRLDANVAEDRELLEELAEEFHPGMRVKAVHFEDYEGVVRFIGNTLLGPGPWIGIELDEPVGRTNGSVAGVFYFYCADKHGAFVPPDCVEPIDDMDDPLVVPKTWDLDEHHFLDAREATKDGRAALGMSSPLAKFQARTSVGMRDYGSESGHSHEYFTTLPPKLRDSPAAGLLSPGGRRSGAPVGVHAHIRTRRVGDARSPQVGATPPHLRDHDQLRSTVPYYEAFAPVHKQPEVGQRVRVKGNLGVVKFVGGTLFEFGQWVGVEFDDAVGKNSGSVAGTFYFKCRPNHGIFVRASRVEWVPWEFAPLPTPPRKRGKKAKKSGAALFIDDADDSDAGSDDLVEVSDDGNADGVATPARRDAEPATQPAFRSPSQGPPASLVIEEVDGVLHIPTAVPAGDGDAPAPVAPKRESEFKNGRSGLKFYQLDSKLQGIFYGFFVGSAVGLAVEERRPSEVSELMADGGRGVYAAAAAQPTPHLSQWYGTDERGGVWGVDGDVGLVVLASLVESGGVVDHGVFARRLAEWAEHGIAETAQMGPIGIEETLHTIVTLPEFATHPMAAAKAVYLKNGKSFADNGAVVRSPFVALCDFGDVDAVAARAKAMAAVTHADPRAIASCVAAAVALALLLQKGKRSYNASNLVYVLKMAFHYARAVGVPDESALKAAIMSGTPATLRLSDPKTCRHTYKALGAAFYALRTGTHFGTTIAEIAAAGGDTDANCALAGALLGAKLGMWAVPVDWPPVNLQFEHRQWPPVHSQFVDGEAPENIYPEWLDLRGVDLRHAQALYAQLLESLKLTVETYSLQEVY